MYAIMGGLPERLLPVKTSLGRYVKENIFSKLGMQDSTYSYDVAKGTGRLAEGLSRQGLNLSANPFAAGITRGTLFPVPKDGTGEDGYCSSFLYASLALH